MRSYQVTIEDDMGEIYEGTLTTDKIDISDIVRIRLMTRMPLYRTGVVIMFEEVGTYEQG